jgi:hypothetical protein
MPKQFYTERDIEDMVAQGKMSLVVDDNVILTDLAFEKANQLNFKLIQPHQKPPAAPERPYLSEPTPKKASPTPAKKFSGNNDDEELRERIRKAVKEKLGDQIDPALLETIITRVLNNVGVN